MRAATHTLAILLAMAATAGARLGETREQCEQRYGKAAKEYPGFGDVADIRVHGKDGIGITVFFVKRPQQTEARAALVIYSWVRLDAPSIFVPAVLTADEEKVFLGTVAGRWEDYTLPPTLASKPGKLAAFPPPPTQLAKRRDAAVKALARAVTALCPQPSLLRSPTDLAHNGVQTFAFRVASGVALFASDGIEPVLAWADKVIADREKANAPPKTKLSGF